MAFLLGTDEAGYGPNLGPLVVSATMWEIPGGSLADLYEVLQGCAARKPAARRVALADSKALFQSGGSLQTLENGVLACLAQLETVPTSWRRLWMSLAPHATGQIDELPWYEGFDREVPIDAAVEEVAELAAAMHRVLEECDVRLVAMRAEAVFPRRFNALVSQHGGKGALLSHTTLGLVQELLEPIGDAPIFVQCDKHGGRNRYGPLLQERFPDFLVEVHKESREESCYRWGPESRRVDCRFRTKGETFLPSALASMISKYLRELAMLAFNQYWCQRVPGLRPTAGYPQDAKRFRSGVQDSFQSLQVDAGCFWRER